MKKGPVFWITFSGLTWFAVGICLLMFGMRLIVFTAVDTGEVSPLFARLVSLAKGKEQAVMVLVSIGLVLGFIKGRLILSKTVNRVVGRISSLPQPIKISDVYSKGYIILIAGMMMLGMLMRWLAIPGFVRGVIDIAVGSALMNGAMFYFRAVFVKQKTN